MARNDRLLEALRWAWPKAWMGLGLGVAIFLAYLHLDEGAEALRHTLGAGWLKAMSYVGQTVLGINAAALLWRFYLVWTYKPMAEVSDQELPTLTVVVPAYNEGRQVLDTLHSICRSDYPADKLQVIAVDDGSQDDTWQWMLKSEQELPGRVTLLQQPRNQGKRHALYAGFLRATGDVFVTIDSDSMIEAPTLRRLVSPFVHDQRVGGVGGNVRVLNQKAGLIPRMLEVAFTYGFDFLRASHSRVNTVMCTPGALSAYHRRAVMPIVDEWLNESFLGQPYRIGEDRFLTNLILRDGYHVLFQSNAMVFTNVPVKYKGLVKMLLRWARSDIRESLMMNGFLFKKFRKGSALGARVNHVLSWIDMTACQLLLVTGMISLLTLPPVVALYTLIGAVVVGIIPMTVYILRHKSLNCLWAIPYSVFYVVALAWIPVYAIFTVHKSGWLTRQIEQKAPFWARLLPVQGGGFWHQVPVYATAGLAALVVGSGTSFWINQPALLPVRVALSQAQANLQPGPDFSIRPASATDQVLAYTHVQDGKRRWHIAAAGSHFDQDNGTIDLRGVEMVFYTKDGGQIQLSSDQGEYDPSDHSLSLLGNVQGTTSTGMRLATNSLYYSEDDLTADTDDEVTLSGPTFKVRGRGILLDMANNKAVFKKAVSSRISSAKGHAAVPATLGS
ncbi:MAG: LPS export ABC transporter periplasmic protein LptC [Pseudomonadota bacterium]